MQQQIYWHSSDFHAAVTLFIMPVFLFNFRLANPSAQGLANCWQSREQSCKSKVSSKHQKTCFRDALLFPHVTDTQLTLAAGARSLETDRLVSQSIKKQSTDNIWHKIKIALQKHITTITNKRLIIGNNNSTQTVGLCSGDQWGPEQKCF